MVVVAGVAGVAGVAVTAVAMTVVVGKIQGTFSTEVLVHEVPRGSTGT